MPSESIAAIRKQIKRPGAELALALSRHLQWFVERECNSVAVHYTKFATGACSLCGITPHLHHARDVEAAIALLVESGIKVEHEELEFCREYKLTVSYDASDVDESRGMSEVFP